MECEALSGAHHGEDPLRAIQRAHLLRRRAGELADPSREGERLDGIALLNQREGADVLVVVVGGRRVRVLMDDGARLLLRPVRLSITHVAVLGLTMAVVGLHMTVVGLRVPMLALVLVPVLV